MLRHKDLPDIPPSSYNKSSLRSQTRPISSTTTATHSTITPLPSDSLKNRLNGARHLYAHHPHSTDSRSFFQDPDSDHATDTALYDADFPRSETPTSTRTKPLFHSFFGISFSRRSSSSTSSPQQSSSSDRKASFSTMTSASEHTKSSRKRSFRLTSRPATPKSLDDPSSKSPYSIPVPSSPLPLSASPRRRSFGLGSSQRSTPKSSTSNLPLPLPQGSQSTRAHGRTHSIGSERLPHDSAVALSEEPPHRTIHKTSISIPETGRNKGKEREKLLTDSGAPLPDFRPSFHSTSQSLPTDPSPITSNHLSSSFQTRPFFSHLPTVDSASSTENDQPGLLPPRRLQAIPRIIHTPPTPQRPREDVDSPPVDPGKAKAVTITHREQVLVSTSHSLTDPQHPTSFKGRFTPRIFRGKDSSKTKDSNGHKSTKRPPAASSDTSPHKPLVSNVVGPTRNMTSHRSKLGSFDFERPVSALNRSSSTVDRYPIDNSSYSKTRLRSLERAISEDDPRGARFHSTMCHPGQADSPIPPHIKPVHTGDTSVLSFSSVSVQTTSTGKGIGSNTPPGQSSSWGRASGRRLLRTSHGTFAFEHSSVPSTPNPPNFDLPTPPNQNDGYMPGLARSQPAISLHTIDARVKQGYDVSDHAKQGYSKPGQRKPKGKGRSLDLGLGLSWAPSRLREEVLMPGLILSREKAKTEKTKANGLDVTKVFGSLLSESRFQTFKEYVHRFDAHMIPLEGPSGLLVRVEKLLTDSGLGEKERNKLMTEFTVFVENHSG